MIGRPSGPNSFTSKGRGEPFERVIPNINITLIFIKDKSTIKQLYFYYWKLIFQQTPAQSRFLRTQKIVPSLRTPAKLS